MLLNNSKDKKKSKSFDDDCIWSITEIKETIFKRNKIRRICNQRNEIPSESGFLTGNFNKKTQRNKRREETKYFGLLSTSIYKKVSFHQLFVFQVNRVNINNFQIENCLARELLKGKKNIRVFHFDSLMFGY